MNEFEFHNPVRVLFGRNQLPKMASLIPADSRIMMIYGGGSIFKNGVYEKVKGVLKSHSVSEFGGIEPNPFYETCMKAADAIRAGKCDFILAVGGGSVIDAVKFIAIAAVYGSGDPWRILSHHEEPKASLPFGVVLTLPATGSEMNRNSVISRKSTKEKLAFGSPLSYPKFSFLLPDAAGSLPQRQVANGIVDAYVHVIEQYLTYPVNTPLQDRMAESILLTLIEEGPKVYRNPADYDSMSNLMWSATMALNGIISCGVAEDWSVHSIGHELTAFHGIDHARTLAIVLPGIWKSLRNEKKEKLVQYGERVWGISSGSPDERIDKAIEKTADFFESLGVMTRLSDYKVKSDTIDKIVSRFEQRGLKGMGDRSLITPAVVRRALEFQM